MRIELHPCYILHHRDYRETSLILEVLSSRHGRVSLLAKSVKYKQKKMNQAALLQPYQKLSLSWTGKGSLPVLTSVEILEQQKSFSGNNLMTGFYLNELLIRLLHENEPDPELFEMYAETLNTLNDNNKEMVLRKFEKYLLKSIGYGLVLDHDVNAETPIDKDKTYYYVLGYGPCAIKPQHGRFVEITGAALLALDEDYFEDESCLPQLRKLMRFILNDLLGEKPLNSRELYHSYINAS